MKNTNRRTFLKAVTAGAVAATLPPPSFADEPGQSAADHATRQASSTSSLLNEVNILQGTDSSFLFSRGNTLPIAAMPFGMAHWTLQTVEQEGWFFHPNDRRLQGVRCTHQLSPWLGDYGNATFLPIGPTASPEPSRRSSSYRPEDAKLSPGLLANRDNPSSTHFPRHLPQPLRLIRCLYGHDSHSHVNIRRYSEQCVCR